MSLLPYRPVYRSAEGPADAEALVTVHALCSQGDGLDPHSLLRSHFTVEAYSQILAQGNRADWVIAQVQDRVIGYALSRWDWLERDGTHVFLHMGWVIPAFHGQGIGTELLARSEAHCRDKASSFAPIAAERYEYCVNAEGGYEDGGRTGGAVGAEELGAGPFLHANGYAPAQTLWEMAWEMALDLSLPVDALAPPLPIGYALRPVLPEHHRAIWQCLGDAYDVDCPNGRFSAVAGEDAYQSWVKGLLAEPSLCFVAWHGSRVAGQVLCRVHDRNGVRVGEVYDVSVGFAHRRRGLARALLSQGIAALHARPVAAILVYTTYEYPTSAWRLYEQVGFRRCAALPRCWRKPLLLR